MRDSVRRHVTAWGPLYAFLVAYFFTTVLGNIIYVTSWGRDWPAMSVHGFSWARFTQPFGFAYWTLLLLPFAAAPPLALLARSAWRPVISRLSRLAMDISLPAYAIVSVALYAFVFQRFIAADVLGKMVAARDAVEAVQARFAIHDAIGFPARIAIMSPLTFLTIYSGVKAVRRGGPFWRGAFTFNIAAMIVCLTALNMKWPLVVFILTIAFQIFATAKHRPFLKGALTAFAGLVCYLVISVFLLRLAPGKLADIQMPASREPVAVVAGDFAARTAIAGIRYAPHLIVVAINRMAVSVPFYWDIFTTRGPMCGTLFDRHILRRPWQCQPTTVVYDAMFPNDGFNGRGTAPAAMHIYEYARGGWPWALCALFVGCAAIGGFMALWPAARENDMLAAVMVMGAPVGYHLSQLPIDSLFFYDHAPVWWAAIFIGNSGLVAVWRTVCGARP